MPPYVGQVLGYQNDTWDNSPTSFTQRWQRDNVNIGGATADEYTLVSGDLGAMIRVGVTPHNAFGAGPEVFSAAVGPVEVAENTATWNPSDDSPNMSYTNSNRNAASSVSFNFEGVRGTHSTADIDDDLMYFEVRVLKYAAVWQAEIGVANSSPNLDSNFGSGQSGGVATRADGSTVIEGGAGAAGGSTFQTGDVVSVWFNRSSKKYWQGRGGIPASGDPAAGTGAQATFGGTSGPWFPFTTLLDPEIMQSRFHSTQAKFRLVSGARLPSNGASVRSGFTAAWDPEDMMLFVASGNDGFVLSNSNRRATAATAGAGATRMIRSQIPVLKDGGKVYWETKLIQNNNGGLLTGTGLHRGDARMNEQIGQTNSCGIRTDASSAASIVKDNTNLFTGLSFLPDGTVVNHCYDPATGKYWIGANNTYYNSGNPAAGTGEIATLSTAHDWWPAVYATYHTGTVDIWDAQFKASEQTYSPPSGFSALGGA